MHRHKLANQVVGLLDFDIENALVVQTLSLDHFSVVDADSQQYRVHNLAQDELDNLVFELLGEETDDYEPSEHVHCVRDDVVAEKHVTHHKDQG